MSERLTTLNDVRRTPDVVLPGRITLLKPHPVLYHIPCMMALKPSRLQERANLTRYSLEISDRIHYLVDHNGNKINPAFEKNTFNFVILKYPGETSDTFELGVSQKNHDYLAKEMTTAKASFITEAPQVVAAGEIQTDPSGKIIGINDQSGSFYVPNTDPALKEKQQSAQNAMVAFGFPMKLFRPFNKPWLTFMTPESSRFSKTKPTIITEEQTITRQTTLKSF